MDTLFWVKLITIYVVLLLPCLLVRQSENSPRQMPDLLQFAKDFLKTSAPAASGNNLCLFKKDSYIYELYHRCIAALSLSATDRRDILLVFRVICRIVLAVSCKRDTPGENMFVFLVNFEIFFCLLSDEWRENIQNTHLGVYMRSDIWYKNNCLHVSNHPGKFHGDIYWLRCSPYSLAVSYSSSKNAWIYNTYL